MWGLLLQDSPQDTESPECLSPACPLPLPLPSPALPGPDSRCRPHHPARHRCLTPAALSGVGQHSKPDTGESLIQHPQSKLQLSYTYSQFLTFCTFCCPYLLRVRHAFFDWLMTSPLSWAHSLQSLASVMCSCCVMYLGKLHLDTVYLPLCNARGILHKAPLLFWWTADSLLISLVSNCLSVTLPSSSLLHLLTQLQ